jgi:putative transposase
VRRPAHRPFHVLGRRKPTPSARALRDEALKPEITRVYQENYSVYGPRKV